MKPEVVALEGEIREAGRKTTGQLRKNMRVPSVLYGPTVKENVLFHVSELEIEKLLSVSRTQFIDLKVDGKNWKTLLKRVEFHPVTDRPLHVDFYVLDASRPVTLRIPIRLTGNAKGVVDGGGRLFQPMQILRIKALPENIPAQIEVDISDLDVGGVFHVSDLDLEGVTILDDPSKAIATVIPPKGAVAGSAEEEEGEETESAEGGEAAESESNE